jgi:hypothetical protein
MPFVEHALVALAIQIAVGLLTRNWWAGAALACGYFIGREISQAEYRWIEHFGAGLRGNLPWWGAFDPRAWPRADQLADVIGPVAATVPFAAVMERRRRRSP